ncbi:MAG TPA: zinc ribbon domain-containing protein [Gemmatimonadales bacterium]|nr:zinc ribbon domain-containing protein [Gemmatimonadales bacterium]
MNSSTTQPCPACGTPASGNFCSACGARLSQRSCAACQAELSAQARFCHRCGTPAGAGALRGIGSPSDRKAWTIAGALCVLLITGIAYKVSSDAPEPTAPDMANAGVSARSSNQAGAPAGPAPDISAMTPRERFDRLFNRIMQAADRRDSAEVERFTPMALGAYRQLDVTDADARYHAAVLHLQVGDFAAARALADTILVESPAHLFGYVIRGEVAKLRGDSTLLGRAERDFLSHYDAEMGAKRVEYLEHQPVLEQFKADALKR